MPTDREKMNAALAASGMDYTDDADVNSFPDLPEGTKIIISIALHNTPNQYAIIPYDEDGKTLEFGMVVRTIIS